MKFNAKVLLLWIWFTLVANPRDMYGSAYITEDLEKEAGKTATILSSANLLDFALSQSILMFALSGYGFVSIVSAVGVNLGLLSIKNNGGLLTVSRRKGSEGLRSGGFFALASLSILSSLMSGVGTELMLNQSGLAQLKAQQEIKLIELDVLSRKPKSSKLYEDAEVACNKAESELQKLSPSDPRYDAAYVKARGMHSERTKIWVLNDPGIPECVKRYMLSILVNTELESIKGDWVKKKEKLSNSGNAVKFLQQEFPDRYALYFTDKEEFKSGVDALAMAFSSFFGKLFKGELGEISLSLFMMSLSILTSIAACWLVWAFAHNEEAIMSWDEELNLEKDRLIEEDLNREKDRLLSTQDKPEESLEDPEKVSVDNEIEATSEAMPDELNS